MLLTRGLQAVVHRRALIAWIVMSVIPLAKGQTQAAAEAQAAAKRYWDSVLTTCGQSVYNVGVPNRGERFPEALDPERNWYEDGRLKEAWLTELRGVVFSTVPTALTQADRMNGVQWKGKTSLRASVAHYRQRDDGVWGEWGEWESLENFGPVATVEIVKKNGRWSPSPTTRGPSCADITAGNFANTLPPVATRLGFPVDGTGIAFAPVKSAFADALRKGEKVDLNRQSLATTLDLRGSVVAPLIIDPMAYNEPNYFYVGRQFPGDIHILAQTADGRFGLITEAAYLRAVRAEVASMNVRMNHGEGLGDVEVDKPGVPFVELGRSTAEVLSSGRYLDDFPKEFRDPSVATLAKGTVLSPVASPDFRYTIVNAGLFRVAILVRTGDQRFGLVLRSDFLSSKPVEQK